MNRRTLLKLGGVAAGGLGLTALGGRYLLLPPPRRRTGASADELARELVQSLDGPQRAATCVPYDHPLRQYHNRGLWTGGSRIWWHFDRDQRQLLVDLFHAGLSDAGRERVAEQYFLRWPGVHVLDVLVSGDPHDPPYQVLFTGPHLNLRVGGACREGVAFGGPQVYGDQRGNMEVGLPGNRYRYQLELATRLFESLSPSELAAATFEHEPMQTAIEHRGTRAPIPGIPLAETSTRSRELARELVEGILVNYPAKDGAYARACLEANDGVGALRLSHYEHGEAGRSGPYQIFRLEGPAAVFHFRGHPHVHAFVNVGKNGDAPLSVGETLAENEAPLDRVAVKALFEDALRTGSGADAAYYELDSVVAPLRAGTIRTGDVYCLESWADSWVVLELDGSALRPALTEALARQGVEVPAGRPLTVATTDYVASELADDRLGRVLSRAPGSDQPRVRDALIAHVRANGIPRPG